MAIDARNSDAAAPANAYAPRPVDPSRFGIEPQLMIWQDAQASFAIPAQDVAEIQLAGLRTRFAQMTEKIPVLKRLADEQGVTRIHRIEDGAALLFKHSVYKSYPFSLIERNRYDRLTAWLDNLTCHDLSGLDASGINAIDDWLDLIYRKAPVRIIHSTGTSGKLSFLPRGRADVALNLRSFALNFEMSGPLRGIEGTPMIVPTFRKGFSAYNSMLDEAVEHFYGGDEGMVLALYPGRLSADLLSLGGRLKAAESKGELGKGQISATLLARRDEFVRQQASAPEHRRQFFRDITVRLRGRRVALSANWSMLHELAEEGLKSGTGRVFAPDSLLIAAGGNKGKALPENHKEMAKSFLGIETHHEGYGMSEMTGGLFPKCSQGRYHAPPWYIVYLLDPDTGAPYPRTGTHTGRLGLIDLTPHTYWGGILSGDEVTVTWDQPCGCGMTGIYLDGAIRRFTEKEGGDDKITCAGAPEAHDNALSFLAELE